MKRISTFSLLLIIAATSFSQAPATIDYAAKARKQKTAGWALVGSGLAVSVVGIAISAGEVEEEIYGLFLLQRTRKSNTGSVVMIAGGAIMLGSIPFFVAASKNNKLAKANHVSLYLKRETGQFIRQNSLVKTSFPSIALRIRL